MGGAEEGTAFLVWGPGYLMYLSHEWIIPLSGIAAAFFLTTAPLFRSRTNVLMVQLLAGAAFAVHYAALGIAVASLVNLIGCAQTVAAMFAARSVNSRALGFVFAALMVVIGLVYWQGPISLLSVIAMSLIAIGRMQQDQIALRALLLSGSGFWLVHDILGQAWIAVIADVGSITAGAAALFAIFFTVRIEWRPTRLA